MNHEVSGDVIIPHQYDSIYQIKFDYKRFYGNRPSESPIYACVSNNTTKIYNSHLQTFYPGQFDEVFFSHEFEERPMDELKPYRYNAIDCVRLRSGELWGYISHKKEYAFHDKLLKTDTFNIVAPKYKYLRFIEEDGGYDDLKYLRKRRILSVATDSLYGAISFETGKEVVPLTLSWPIRSYNQKYSRRGIETYSDRAGIINYFIAKPNSQSKKFLIINTDHPELTFLIEDRLKLDIQREFGGRYMYIVTGGSQQHTLEIYNFDTGKKLFSFPYNKSCRIQETRWHSNILEIFMNCSEQKERVVLWFNLTTGKEILHYRHKNLFPLDFVLLENTQTTEVLKNKKQIGILVGENENMQIQWKDRVYLKTP